MRSWFDWLFRDRRTGRVTIVQFPNLALWLYLVTVVASRVASDDSGVRTAIDWIGVAALGLWATDEVFRGVNPWRRLLGLVVGAFTIARLIELAG